jgi:hypothetical protein
VKEVDAGMEKIPLMLVTGGTQANFIDQTINLHPSTTHWLNPPFRNGSAQLISVNISSEQSTLCL